MIFKSYQLKENFDEIIKKKAILVYGENLGLISDIKKFIKLKFEGAEIVNLFQEEIIKRKEIIYNETQNSSLFSSTKILIINEISDKLFELYSEIYENPNDDNKIIMLANLLDKKSKIRNLFEKDKNLAIIPCYNDNELTLRNYIKNSLKEFQNLNSDMISEIITNSNSKRSVIKNELEKIKSCFSDKIIDEKKLESLLNYREINDFSLLRDIALTGNKEKLKKILGFTKFSNENIMFYLTSLAIRLNKISDLHDINEEHKSLNKSLSEMKPKVFWKDKDQFLNEAKKLNKTKINQLLNELKSLEVIIKTSSKLNSDVLLKNFLVRTCFEISTSS
tara:strand:- start:116 stop:1120 length:1005 start_codon:yes stop_codon:yes gene_type:complete